MQFQDDVGPAVSMGAPPRRVVSLVPSLNQALCDLGLVDGKAGTGYGCRMDAHLRHLHQAVHQPP